MSPLDPATARGFWRGVARDVATGARRLLVAWVDGRLAGTVQLNLATPPNQPHRADVAKMLVHPAARRRGAARALMQRAEAVARDAGRTLLTLDTSSDGVAEPLYLSLGFTAIGRIPNYALNPDGSFCDTTIMFKTLN
jgi:GNAT superfamily N-acetyltransferase